jgi:hypothetical protein
VPARLAGGQLVQFAGLKVEVVARTDDAHAEVADGQLPTGFEVARVVESHGVPAIDEGHASSAEYLAQVAAHDEGGILIDPDPEETGVAGDHQEETLQPAALREVRVDDRVEREQAKSGANV